MNSSQLATHILVVDGDDEVCALICGLLLNAGHSVEIAADWAETILLHHKEPAAVIVAIVNVPNPQRINDLLQLKRGCQGAKILAITAPHAQAAASLASQLGVDQCVYRPFDHFQFLSAVEQLAESHGRL
jgi:DNA-binding response OmpR family regulator